MPTTENLLQTMETTLKNLVPPEELGVKAEQIRKIEELKKVRNAIVLGHNYMEPALYHFASDIRGDSLELCRQAAETNADVIVFCGVRFMAESAKILNPGKKVLLPTPKGGCSLAASITAEDVRKLKAAFPGVPVMTYVNTYADVKAETDICCTSGNADRVLDHLAADTVLFLPDAFLAQNVAKEKGWRALSSREAIVAKEKGDSLKKTVIYWEGKCEVHEQFTPEDVDAVRASHPSVRVLAHPECPPDVLEKADFSGSTSKMIQAVQEKDADAYLLLTECSMGDNIMAAHPDKNILRLCSFRCPHMNEITLDQLLWSLENMEEEIFVDETLAERSRGAIERMLEI